MNNSLDDCFNYLIQKDLQKNYQLLKISETNKVSRHIDFFQNQISTLEGAKDIVWSIGGWLSFYELIMYEQKRADWKNWTLKMDNRIRKTTCTYY
jgi:hypothetical protein